MDKVICPYCGKEMQLCEDHNWGGYVDGYTYCCPVCESESPYKATEDEARAAALRRAQTENRPLTLREVQCFRDCPVLLVEYYKGRLEWMQTNHVINYMASPDSETSTEYGVSWRCWDPLKGYPTNALREAVAWG